jgi:hypothetical protein
VLTPAFALRGHVHSRTAWRLHACVRALVCRFGGLVALINRYHDGTKSLVEANKYELEFFRTVGWVKEKRASPAPPLRLARSLRRPPHCLPCPALPSAFCPRCWTTWLRCTPRWSRSCPSWSGAFRHRTSSPSSTSSATAPFER